MRLVGRSLYILVFFMLVGPSLLAQSEMDTIKIIDSLNYDVQINKIFIIGNEKTKPRIIRRELAIEEGQVINKSKLVGMLDWEKKKVFNLALFNTVEMVILDKSESEVDILITVSERWYIWPSLIFRPVDRNFNDWWVNRDRDLSRVNYGGSLTHHNFGGRKEKLRISLRLGFTTTVDFGYSFPYIDKEQRHGLSFLMSYNEMKTVDYNTIDHRPQQYQSEQVLRRRFTPRITYRYRDGFYNSFFARITYDQSTVADSLNILNENYLVNGITSQKFMQFGAGFVRDTRDYQSYPLKGIYISTLISKLGMGFFDDGRDQWYSSLFVKKYMDLNKGWYLGSSAIGVLSSRQNQTWATYFRFGIENDIIRGFEAPLIESPTYIIQKNTLRKRLFQGQHDFGKLVPLKQFRKVPYAMYAKVYYDHGYADRYPNYDGSDRLTRSYLYGLGAGFDFIGSYDTVLRFEWTYNAEGDIIFAFDLKADI